MLRFTNLTPVYEKDGSIIEYRVSVDNNTDNNSISANLTIKPEDLDLSHVLVVCKKKLEESFNSKEGEGNDIA